MTPIRSRMLALLLVPTFALSLHAQDVHRDKALLASPRNEFLDSIKTLLSRSGKDAAEPKKAFLVDFSSMKLPMEVSEFTRVPHHPPISQALSGMCWAFAGTSFLESEITRLTGRTIKLSELFTVYWEYVEKAKRYVAERGNSAFSEGSEANAVLRIGKMHGMLPAEAYAGLAGGKPVHDHAAMVAEMRTYLKNVKESAAWDEKEVVATIRAIMDHHLGVPPERITVDGKLLTPAEYFTNVVRLDPDDYVPIMSLMQAPYYTRAELEVHDNWWHSRDYCNVPLEMFMSTIRNAVRRGFSVAIGGDTSEPGHEGHAGVAIIPTFDIPSAYIDENARNFRFRNGTTGDDHAIHIVGYKQDGTRDWFLVKDSGSGSRNNSHPGYYFFHEDYVKLKMLYALVHKDAAADIMAKMLK